MEKPDFIIIEADNLIKLETLEILKNLFPRDPKLEEELAEDMRQKGYDHSKPIIVWKKQDADGTVHLIIVDGYTRYYAAIKAHVYILIVEMEFANEDEAIRYAYRCQLKRRNLTPAQMMEYIQRFEHLTSRQVAKELGISPSHAQRIKKIIKEGRIELQKAVKDGEKSVYAAAEEMREVPSQPQDQMGQTASIDATEGEEDRQLGATPNTPQDEKEQPAPTDEVQDKEGDEEEREKMGALGAVSTTLHDEKEQTASTDVACNEGGAEEKSYATYLDELDEDIKGGKEPRWKMNRELILSKYSREQIETKFSVLGRTLDILFLYDEGRLIKLLRKWMENHSSSKQVA